MKSYFKFLLTLYGIALAVCLVCRIILKLNYMDTLTGFYSGGDLSVLIFNVLLASAPVIMFASNRLKRADDDYPLDATSRPLMVLSLLTGAVMIAFAVVGAPESQLHQNYSELFCTIRDGVILVLGVISGLAFLYLGFGGVFGRKKVPAGLLIAVPAVWQIVMLVLRYNYYTTVISISDHLLLVLFMIFNSLFLLGMARTLCMQMRKDGRNYAIPSGLCSSLCGFLLVLPNYAYMGVNLKPMPVGLLGLFESAYILIMSLYALIFVISLMRSIKRV